LSILPAAFASAPEIIKAPNRRGKEFLPQYSHAKKQAAKAGGCN
jgi:hypothetical protein